MLYFVLIRIKMQLRRFDSCDAKSNVNVRISGGGGWPRIPRPRPASKALGQRDPEFVGCAAKPWPDLRSHERMNSPRGSTAAPWDAIHPDALYYRLKEIPHLDRLCAHRR
jgi:hypothetical protein